MWPPILTVVGLVLETIAFIYGGRKYLPFWKPMKEKKLREIENRGSSFDERIKRREREWFISFGLLAIGVILQAVDTLI